MFERYTEHARRTIFFARFEASNHGSAEIESGHLLLGALRETAAIGGFVSAEQSARIREGLERELNRAAGTPVSIDLPLSEESKRILAFGAEEAERLGHGFIDVAHLLLGMLRKPDSLPARVLREAAITPVVPLQPPPGLPHGLRPGFASAGGGGGSWSMTPEGKVADGHFSRSFSDPEGRHTETIHATRGRRFVVQSHFKSDGDRCTFTVRLNAGKQEFRHQFDFDWKDLPEVEE